MDNQPPVRDNWEKLLGYALRRWRKLRSAKLNLRKIFFISTFLLALNYTLEFVTNIYSLVVSSSAYVFNWYDLFALACLLIMSTPILVLVALLYKFNTRAVVRPLYRNLALAAACYVAIFSALPTFRYLFTDAYFALSTLDIHPLGNGSVVEQLVHWLKFTWSTSGFLMDMNLVGTICAKTALILLLIVIYFQSTAQPVSGKHTQILRETAKIATLTACIAILFAFISAIAYGFKLSQDANLSEFLRYQSNAGFIDRHFGYWWQYAFKSALSVLAKFIWALPPWVYYRYFVQLANGQGAVNSQHRNADAEPVSES